MRRKRRSKKYPTPSYSVQEITPSPVEFDVSAERKARRRQTMRRWLELSRQRQFSKTGAVCFGRTLAAHGLIGLLLGEKALALQCLRTGQLFLSGSHGSGKPVEVDDGPIIVRAVDPKKWGISSDGDGWTCTASTMYVPFDSSKDADRWTLHAICGWLLDGRHETESFKRASDAFEQYRKRNRSKQPNCWWENIACPVFYCAGDDRRCLQYCERDLKFKPAKTPQAVRTSPQMAYMLAQHRSQGKWSAKQVTGAMQAFLKANMLKLLDTGWGELALWMKIAFWDGNLDRRRPVESFLKWHELLPERQRRKARKHEKGISAPRFELALS